jgi:hypothetical protein
VVSKKARKTVKGVPAAVGAAAGVKSVKAAVSDAPAQARVLVDELNERLVPALHSAREHLTPVLADARGRIGDTVDERVVPALHDAGERLAPVLASAKVRAGETARDVGSRLADRAEPYAHEAARRGGNALEALKGTDVVTPSKKRGGFFGKFLLVGALGGLAFAAWRALAGPKDDPWTDSAGTGSTGGLADKVTAKAGGLADKVKDTASGVAGTVKSKVAGGTDATDDGSPSAEENAYVSDLGTFATPGMDEPVVVVEVVEEVNPIPLDGVTESTEDH